MNRLIPLLLLLFACQAIADDFAVVSQAIPTSTGAQSTTSTDLASQTGVGSIYLLGHGTVVDTSISSQIVSGAILNIGLSDATNEELQIACINDDEATQDAEHRLVSTRLLYFDDPACDLGTITDFAAANGGVTNGQALQWDGASAAVPLMAVGLLAGSHWNVATGIIDEGTTSEDAIIGGASTVTGLGFTPEAVIFTYTGQDASQSTTEARSGFGFAAGVTTTVTTRAVALYVEDNVAAGATDAYVANNRTGVMIDNTSVVRSVELTEFTSGGFDVTMRDAAGSNGVIYYMALESSTYDFDVGSFDVPTSGNETVSTSVDPEMLIQVMTQVTSENTFTSGAAAGSLSVFMTDIDDDMIGITQSNEESADPTNVNQTVSDYNVVLLDDGTKDIEGTTALEEGQFVLTLTNNPASVTKNIYLAAGPAKTELTDNLLIRLQLDEGTGTSIADETSTWTCTASDSSWVVDGTYGDVYVSTTTNNIDCGDETLGGTDFTWSMWIYPDTLTGDQMLVTKYVTSAGGRSFRLLVDADVDLRFLVSDDGTSNEERQAPGVSIIDENWYNLIVTYASGVWALYIDDGAAETTNGDFSTELSIHDGTANLYVGSLTGSTSGFRGRMREVAIWDRVLKSGERTAVFNDNWDDGSPLRRRR